MTRARFSSPAATDLPAPDTAWLADPEIFAVGRRPHRSDHIAYPSRAAALAGGPTPLRQSLDGTWRCHAAARVADVPAGFFVRDYDVSGWREIAVPGHLQMQGFGAHQYVNTQYPWDGHAEIRPPEIPEANLVGCYARDFTPGAMLDGAGADLVFEGVETAFYVWVNGVFVGYSEDSFTPARFDVTAQLVDGVNRLAGRGLSALVGELDRGPGLLASDRHLPPRLSGSASPGASLRSRPRARRCLRTSRLAASPWR